MRAKIIATGPSTTDFCQISSANLQELLEREGEDCYICKNVQGKRPKAILHNN